MEKVKIDFRKTRFITSSPDIKRLPTDLGSEIALQDALTQESPQL